jgi:hypothetical protein
MILLLLALIFLMASVGLFAWITFARYKYYYSGSFKYITQQYIAAFASMVCLFFAIAMYGWHCVSRVSR